MAFTADKVRQGVQKDTGYSIDNSLRFNDDDSAYLSWTPGSAGNRKTWTWSGWYKMGNGGAGNWAMLFGADNGAGGDEGVYIRSNQVFMTYGGGSNLSATQVLRDPSAWYHLMVVRDTTLSTAGDRVKMYINGNRITDFGTETYPSQNAEGIVGVSGYSHEIMGNYHYVDGYLAEVHFIDGQALDPTSFGETGTYGEWKPIEVTGMTYGTNGFYLPFSNTGTKHTITANGDAQHSTAQSKIGGSSMYFDGSGDYLTIPSTSDFDFGTGDYTLEFWIRNGTANPIMHIDAYDGSGLLISYEGSGYVFRPGNGGGWGLTLTHTVSLDSSNWHHISVVCSSGTTTMYYDGVGVANSTTVVDVDWAGAVSGIGGRYGGSPIYAPYIGYLDEIRISNSARYTSNFTPSTTAFTEDANTLLLIHSDTTNGSTTFTDDSGVVGGLGTDASSNTNNWTVNNLAATDQMLDSPTNNFCTWNPLMKGGRTALSEGNLKVNNTSAIQNNYNGTIGTQLITSGKWYWEHMYTNPKDGMLIGMFRAPSTNFNAWLSDGDGGNIWVADGAFHWGSRVEYDSSPPYLGITVGNNNILQIAFDADTGDMYVGVNGTWANSGSAVMTGISLNGAAGWVTGVRCNAESGTFYSYANFGQDSSFAGNKTAQGNQDSNSIGDFYYTPPTDFLALCTSNLPDPAVIPSEHFNTVLWTGTGSSNARTDVGFQPDFTWIKGRSHISNHRLMNSIAGATKYLLSNAPQAEGTDSQVMSSFDSNGFTVGTEDDTNGSSKTFVAWNWKAGGTGVSNTNGSITSTVSANADAGFSIVSWTGDGSDATIGHSLNSVPKMIIHKHRSGSVQWNVYHESAGTGGYLRIDGTHAWNSNSGFFGTAPTSSVFSPGSHSYMSGSGHNNIAYCFADVDGYSKFGSYTGNQNSDGPFLFTGFRPAFVVIQPITTADDGWLMFDNKRDSDGNRNDQTLYINSSAVETDRSAASGSASRGIDFLSNGFKIRGWNSNLNYSSRDYLYFAFAESPFKHTNAR